MRHFSLSPALSRKRERGIKIGSQFPPRTSRQSARTGAQAWFGLSLRSPTITVKAEFDRQFFSAAYDAGTTVSVGDRPYTLLFSHCSFIVLARRRAHIRYSSPPTLMA